MNKWWMVNVVWYDGVEAYVSKFVLKIEGEDKTEAEKMVKTHLADSGEVLKLDVLYPVTLENIMALKDSDNVFDNVTFDRFKEFYF